MMAVFDGSLYSEALQMQTGVTVILPNEGDGGPR